MKLRLMPEYGCSPIWVETAGPAKYLPIAELHVEQSLRERLQHWDDRFQATFNATYPPDSGFGDPKELATFLADGDALAEQLRQHFECVEFVRNTI